MKNIFNHTVRFVFASALLLSVSSCYPDLYEEGDSYLEGVEHAQGGSHAAAKPHDGEAAPHGDEHANNEHVGEEHKDDHKNDEHKEGGH